MRDLGPPYFCKEGCIFYFRISRSQSSLTSRHTNIVPINQGPLLVLGKFSPKEIPSNTFDRFQHPFRSNGNREEVDRQGLEDIFKEGKVTMNIEGEEGLGGDLRFHLV